ncbi:uncharacterized protein LOC143851617 [Tasmannia lanceolata]|uniref:uncharacterized protein LOC143851617 n=1 Tax=Tasmannia lanceolata TaxID=3420 RepID=UPI004063E885
MEGNGSVINHLESDVDVRLPPRKRLLAGLKKQNCESVSSSSYSSEFGAQLRDLLSVDSKNAHLSVEQVVEASRSAALDAAKVAAAAKATAMEKATVAAKTAADAKSALELVASIAENKTRRKNKPKKHVPIKLFYKGRRRIENHDSDEQLAHRLHRSMNSSPRISKSSINSNSKVYSRENRREPPVLEKAKVSNEGLVCEGSPPSICDTAVNGGDVECLEPITNVVSSHKLENKSFMCAETDYFGKEKVPGERDHEIKNSTRKRHSELEARGVNSGKKARIKQKKMSLSLCSKRDREKPKDKLDSEGFPSTAEPKSKCTVENTPLFAVEPPSEGDLEVETIPKWKCNEFTAPQCNAERKILHPLCPSATMTTVSAMIKVDQ